MAEVVEQLSLADLQTERERLRADQARENFEQALAETCTAANLYAAESAAYAALREALGEMAGRMADVIEGETDETRIHYLLSDTAHDVLREAGDAAADATADVLPQVGDAIRRGIRPRDLLTVSQWADRHRWLDSGTNAPGQWQTSRTPYLREIQDSLSEHSPVREVSFIKASGVGGTEVLYNWIGYIMHHLGNKDMLLVVPTLELRNRSLNPRLRKMMEETPVLKALASSASRSRTNRDDLLEYGARARILKAGANSADSMRSDHLPYVAKDEVDAYPWDVGGEGDPDILIANRQRTFSRRKTYNVSTPTEEGASRIDRAYQRSDQRRFHVPCPHCGHSHPLEWRHFQWRTAPTEQTGSTKTVTEAWMVCPDCGGVIEEGHKTDMLADGCWIPQRPHIKRHRGYHLNALYAPIGLGLTWRDIAQAWLNAQNDSSELKAFVNTYLGEVWREEGESIDDLNLITRLQDYQRADLPAVLITAGVDVQKDRLEASIVAWGAGEEAWLLDHLIIPGETSEAGEGAWPDLDQALADEGVQYGCIDSGYHADAVYQFVGNRRWLYAIKGMEGMHRPLVEDKRKRKQRLRYRRKRGVPIEPVGVDNGKSIIYSRLKLPQAGPGYIHFPNHPAFDDEYFAQLGAEKLVPRARRGRTYMEWVKTRSRNEALDCAVYALAAVRLSGVDLDAEAEAGRFVTLSRAEYDRIKREAAAQQPTAPTTEASPPGGGFGSDDWAL